MLAVGRLLRISLFPSAVADVSAGIVLGSGGAWLAGADGALLILASLGVYHGGMALNDWADRESDARTRPERPIPSGAVPAGAALALALGLLAGGVLAALAVTPRAGAWMAGVATCAALYDLAGRGAWRGPLLLGACRAGNFALGLLTPAWIAGAALPESEALLAVPLLYGTYVFAISRLGRLEDDEDPRPLGRRPQRALASATFALAAVPLVALFAGAQGRWLGAGAAAAVAWAGAFGLAQLALRSEWERAEVGRAMGAALRRLLVFTAAATLLALGGADGTWQWLPLVAAAAILAGYPISFWLRRVFPPS
ncbi:MAG: UbiA family prenyltransferase [bacterium]|nr:UbiA family prenyltransferase [bacterium]